jgi:hypothetical protein
LDRLEPTPAKQVSNGSWAQDVSRAESILPQIAADETEYREVANLAEQVGADYKGRFLIELLQNAEDQVTRANLHDATVVIVRTKDCLAIFNQGLPFHAKGIRAVTSAGISPKDTEKSLGNKGIGFKAVFQVSARPELYSADMKGGSLAGAVKAFQSITLPSTMRLSWMNSGTYSRACSRPILSAKHSSRSDSVFRLPRARFERLFSNPPCDALSEFAGQRIRAAEAVVELENRRPVRVLRVIFHYMHFDQTGRLDRERFLEDGVTVMEAGMSVFNLEPRDPRVIQARQRFAARRRDHSV